MQFGAVSGFEVPPPIQVPSSSIGAGVRNTFAVTYLPLSPLSEWKQNNGVGDVYADVDGDGLNALLEYAADGDVKVPDWKPLLRVSGSPAQNAVTEFEVYVSGTAEGIIYEVQAVDSLEEFALPGEIEILATLTSADGSSGYLTVLDTKSIGAFPSRYARVVISPVPVP